MATDDLRGVYHYCPYILDVHLHVLEAVTDLIP